MDIKQLESFVAVVNHKSFSRAAEKLFMTQPTITNHIQKLEEELETALLNRTNKKVSLTKAGEILFQHANNILNIKQTAQYELNDYKGKVQGILEICSSSIPSQYILPGLLKTFVDQHRDVSFLLHQKNSQHVINDILSGQINYGIVGGLYEHPSLAYIDFFDDHLTLVASSQKHIPCPEDGVMSKDLLKSEKIIFREEGSSSRLLIEETLKCHGLTPQMLQIVSYIEDNETIKQLVALDVGLSFISEIAIKKELALGLIKAYRVEGMHFNRKFYFVYHKNRYLSPLDQAFRDFVIPYARSIR